MTRLSMAEAETLAAVLPLWAIDPAGTSMSRGLVFDNFDAAMHFINAVAQAAREQDHHPEWSNSYDRVHIRLTTHDAGGLTHKDVELAHAVDAAAVASGGQVICAEA